MYYQNPIANASHPFALVNNPSSQVMAAGSLAPQGLFGDIVGAVAPIAGQAVGGLLGNAKLGGQIGSAVGQIGSTVLPFSAAPTLAPQGLFGDILGAVAPIGGQAIGGLLGNAKLGGQIGSAVGQIGSSVLPFSAVPTLAPQGLVGNIVSQVAPVAGSAIGSAFGDKQLGQMIGNAAGYAAGQYIPFSAAPTLAPQGLVGNIVSQVAPVAGGAIGSAFGDKQLGQMIGNAAGYAAGQYLPFSAAPTLAPQGLFGDIVGTVAPIAGTIFGGPVGAAVGGVAGNLAKNLIPFSAVPTLAPQGLVGNIVSQVAPVAGSAIGSAFGDKELGQMIGNAAGYAAGQYLPFSAAPTLGQPMVMCQR